MRPLSNLLLPSFLLFALCLPWACSNSGGAGKTQALQEIDFPTPTPPPLTTPVSMPITLTAEEPTPTDTPEPMEYVVEEAKGTVLLVQNGYPEPVTLEEEETVAAGDEIITKGDSQATLSLDENTLIRLGPDSDLHITDLKPNETDGFISRMELVGGKIMSEVEKLSDSKSTFEVTSGGVVCGVRGTAFEVQKQGQEVQTNTYRGVVEMKKGHYIQKIKANEHLSFSFKKKSFLGKRRINTQEMGRYHAWNAKLGGFQQKALERRKLMNSLKQLSPEEKSRVLKQMKETPPHQRLQALRHAVNGPSSPGPLPQVHSNQSHKTQSQMPQGRKIQGRMPQGQINGGGIKNKSAVKNIHHSPAIQNNGLSRGKGSQAKLQPPARHPQHVSPNAPKPRGPKREFKVQHPNPNKGRKNKKQDEDK